MELSNYVIDNYNNPYVDNEEYEDSYKEEVNEVLRELFMF